MSRLSVCKKFDRHHSAETCRALASPDRGLGCRQDSIGHVGQRGAVEVGTHPQAFFSPLFLETVPSSSTRSAAQQGPGRCGALFPLSFLPLHHNQPHQCQAAVKSCPLSRSERVMSVPGPGRLGLIGAAVSRRPQFLTIPSLLSTPILLSISRHHQRHHPPQSAPAACPSALPVRPPAPSSLLFRAFVQTSAPPPRPSPQLLPARPLPPAPIPNPPRYVLGANGQPSFISRFVADNMGSETMTTLAMKVLGLAKNAGRWFFPRLGPSPAQSSPAPHSVNRCLDLLDDVFEDIAYRRMCGRGLGLIRPITSEPTADDDMDEDDDDDDWMFVEDPIRAMFAPRAPSPSSTTTTLVEGPVAASPSSTPTPPTSTRTRRARRTRRRRVRRSPRDAGRPLPPPPRRRRLGASAPLGSPLVGFEESDTWVRLG